MKLLSDQLKNTELITGPVFLNFCQEEQENSVEKGRNIFKFLIYNNNFNNILYNNRWHNHLNPDINKDRWTEEEDQKIIMAHKK